MPIGGTILRILLHLLTTGRNGLEDLLHTSGGGVKEWADLLLNRILDLGGLLVEGGVGGDDTVDLMHRGRQTVRNVLEAALNLRREFGSTVPNLLEVGKHGVAEFVDFRLSGCVGGGGGLDDTLGSERGLVSVGRTSAR